jgi:hypothetical protein
MLDELKKEVESRISDIRPNIKDIIKIYLGRFDEHYVTNVRYSWKFLDFPQVLMLKCKYWSSSEIPKPSLETLENLDKLYRANKADIKVELAIKDIKKRCLQYLRDTDHMFLTDYKFDNQAEKMYYIDYRKYLRAFPGTVNRNDVNQVVVLTFEEWKKTKGY